MRKDKNKAKAQLMSELGQLRRQNAQLTAARAELKCAEQRLRRSIQALEVRNRIAEVFLAVPGNRMYREVLDVLLEATDSRYGVFGYIDENGAYVVPWAAVDAGNKRHNAQVTVFPRDTWEDTAGARAIREKRSIYSNEPLADMPHPHIPIRRHVSVPILHQGEVIGLIQAANKDTDYDERDIAFLETIAGAIAPALTARLQRERQENSRNRALETLRKAHRELEVTLQEQTEELTRATKNLQDEIALRTCAEERSRRQNVVSAAVGRILQGVSACMNGEEVARTCLAVALRLTGSKFGYFGEANPLGRFDVIALANPDWDACKTLESDAAIHIVNMEIRGIWGRVLKEGQSHIVNGPIAYPDRAGVPEGHPPLTCFLGAPFKQSGTILGTVALANKPSGYDDVDREAMEVLSPVIVAALMYKRAEVSLREAQQELARREKPADWGCLAGEANHESVDQIRPVDKARQSVFHCLRKTAVRFSSWLGRSDKSNDSRRKVLIASAQPGFQEAVKCALQGQNKVTVVETDDTGEEVLKIARDTRPNVVVVDLGSAGMSGFRAISLLRDQLSDARIIAVSPCDTKSVKHTAHECGADELVMGAVQGRDFVQAIRRALLLP